MTLDQLPRIEAYIMCLLSKEAYNPAAIEGQQRMKKAVTRASKRAHTKASMSMVIAARLQAGQCLSGENPFSTSDSALNSGSYSGGSSAGSELHSASASLPQFRSQNSFGCKASRLVTGIKVQGYQGQDCYLRRYKDTFSYLSNDIYR
jgi:hypothetical protein